MFYLMLLLKIFQVTISVVFTINCWGLIPAQHKNTSTIEVITKGLSLLKSESVKVLLSKLTDACIIIH